MGNKEKHDELKEPIRSLSREITQKYVQELVREAIKQAMKNKVRGLNEKNVLKLEKQMKIKSDQERLEQFKEPAEEISRSIRESSIEGNKALGQMSKILESSIKPPLPLIFKALFILVIVGTPLLLFFIFMPSLSVAPENLDLAEGVSESAQLEVSNSGGGILLWTASSNQPWITLSPERGANEGNVIVLVDTEDMEEGTYEGTVTIKSNAGTEQCPIRLVVGSEHTEMIINPHSLEFYLAEGEVASRELQISKEGSGTFEWHINPDTECPWITMSQESGTSSDILTVTANTEGLEPDTYEGTITIESNAGTEQCPIRLVVGSQPPVLAVDPLFIDFELEEGESGEEELRISNEGEGDLEWKVSADESWVSLSPASGTNSGNVTVTVNTENLNLGEEYEGTVTIESNAESEECIISLNVLQEGEEKEETILAVDPDPLFLDFTLAEGEWDSEEFYVSNEGEGELEWNIVSDTDWPSWISIDPISGTNSETVTVEVDAADLTSGNYNTTFRVESNEEYEEGSVNLKVSGETGPDLKTSLEIVGDATRTVKGDSAYISVPISVVVRNQGDQAANIFKVSTEYTNSSGTYPVAFEVPGESEREYPYTDEPLNPEEEITFEGEVLFNDSLSDETVYLKAIADSCSEDELVSEYCRVEESNEDNNESPEVEVYLPVPELEGPDLVVTSLKVNNFEPNMSKKTTYIELPIRVTVRNQGDEAADIFKVETVYFINNETYTIPFRVLGENDTTFPYTDEPLGPGEEITFDGEVLFNYSMEDKIVSIKAIADSCKEDWGAPYCRVEESNEDNNESPEVEVVVNLPFSE